MVLEYLPGTGRVGVIAFCGSYDQKTEKKTKKAIF